MRDVLDKLEKEAHTAAARATKRLLLARLHETRALDERLLAGKPLATFDPPPLALPFATLQLQACLASRDPPAVEPLLWNPYCGTPAVEPLLWNRRRA